MMETNVFLPTDKYWSLMCVQKNVLTIIGMVIVKDMFGVV